MRIFLFPMVTRGPATGRIANAMPKYRPDSMPTIVAPAPRYAA